MITCNEFIITEQFQEYREKVITREYGIRLIHSNHNEVEVTISYFNQKKGIATIRPTYSAEECKDHVRMIKTLLRHIHYRHPEITQFTLQDNTMVGCHFPLYNLSIALNGCTWYEHYFHAILGSEEEHIRYRAEVDAFLALPIQRINIPLEWGSYDASHQDHLSFFQSIPFDTLSHDAIWRLIWYIKENIHSRKEDWLINVLTMDRPPVRPNYYLPNDFERDGQLLGLGLRLEDV